MALYLHTGGQRVPRAALDDIATPAATTSHQPLPHNTFVTDTLSAIDKLGWEVAKEEYAIAKDGQRFFGYLEIAREVDADNGYSALLGLRNSHDKSFSAEFVCGSRVFVCDNLAFSGDVRIARKHTSRILDHIQQLITDALGKFQIEMISNDTRFLAYKGTEIDDVLANNLIIELFRANALSTLRIPGVVKEWYEPAHEEHAAYGKSIWRLFNAVTEVLKNEGSLMNLPAYTKRLTARIDNFCIDRGSLNFPKLLEMAA